MIRDSAWTTEAEVAFLRALGYGVFRDPRSGGASPHLAPRAVLLRRYVESMAHRHDWGVIDAEVVATQCRAMLQREAEQPPTHPRTRPRGARSKEKNTT